MYKHINFKRIVGLCFLSMLITGIFAVNARADKKTDCDYGMDMSKKNLTGAAEAKSDNKWAGSREIYLGGTWTNGDYNYDGQLIDKFTFELTKNSNDKSPLSCEAELYIDNGNTKYCTYQIIEFCNYILYLTGDSTPPELDEQKLSLFEQFGSEFKENSNAELSSIMAENESEQKSCDCGAEYQDMSDSEILEKLITQLLEMYADGLLDDFDQDKLNEIIEGLLESYELYSLAESQSEVTEQTQGENNGAIVAEIKHNDPVCRIIGIDCDTDEPVISCFYGHRVENTKIKNGDEVTNEHILAFEEIYIGGTLIPYPEGPSHTGVYLYDGYFVGKYRKDFKYNDNSDVFWKVEIGLNGSTLEYCTMRDQEYSDKTRTKESCESLYIDIK